MQIRTSTTLFAVILLASFTATGYAAKAPTPPPAKAPAADGPQVEAASPLFDAGTVSRGEKIRHDFELVNHGSAPLKIREVRPSCGCTVASYDAEIAPGKQGHVKVEVDTGSFRGPIAKHVTVFSNDAATPSLDLTIRAKVQPIVDMLPGYARYIHVRGSGPQAVKQNLWATDGRKLEIVGARSPFPFLEVTYHRASADERLAEGPADQWVVVTTLASDAPRGPVSGDVVLDTNDPKQGKLTLPVTGFVHAILEVTPQIADLGHFPADQPRKGSLLVINYSKQEVHVTSADTDVPGLTARVEPRPEGHRFNVFLDLAPGQPSGPLSGKITLHTDSTTLPELVVDVKGVVE